MALRAGRTSAARMRRAVVAVGCGAGERSRRLTSPRWSDRQCCSNKLFHVMSYSSLGFLRRGSLSIDRLGLCQHLRARRQRRGGRRAQLHARGRGARAAARRHTLRAPKHLGVRSGSVSSLPHDVGSPKQHSRSSTARKHKERREEGKDGGRKSLAEGIAKENTGANGEEKKAGAHIIPKKGDVR